MKKVIKNKVYDTDTAKLIGQKEHDNGTIVALYQKKTGHYFVYHKSIVGEQELIKPIDLADAKIIGKELLSVEDYNCHFGENLTGDDIEITAAFRVKQGVHIRLKQIAVEEHCTVGELLERFVNKYYEGV